MKQENVEIINSKEIFAGKLSAKLLTESAKKNTGVNKDLILECLTEFERMGYKMVDVTGPGDYGDPEENYNNFWKDIILDKNGKVDLEQIKKELNDYKFLLEELPQIYGHITEGMLSKLNYDAKTVMRISDQFINQHVAEMEEGWLDEYFSMNGGVVLLNTNTECYNDGTADGTKDVDRATVYNYKTAKAIFSCSSETTIMLTKDNVDWVSGIERDRFIEMLKSVQKELKPSDFIEENNSVEEKE